MNKKSLISTKKSLSRNKHIPSVPSIKIINQNTILTHTKTDDELNSKYEDNHDDWQTFISNNQINKRNESLLHETLCNQKSL